MPIVLQIMKYMKKSRHVEQTKAVIGKIDEAIDVMVQVQHWTAMRQYGRVLQGNGWTMYVCMYVYIFKVSKGISIT